MLSLTVMIAALNSALSGLHSASQKLDRAASGIVSGGTQPSGSGLAGGLVALEEARMQFTASARLIGALARNEQRLLDILA